MAYKVIKKYTDPFTKADVLPDDIVEIPEEYLKGYLPYVVKLEEPKPPMIPETKAPAIAKKGKRGGK